MFRKWQTFPLLHTPPKHYATGEKFPFVSTSQLRFFLFIGNLNVRDKRMEWLLQLYQITNWERERERKRENKTNKILLSLGGDQGWFPHLVDIYIFPYPLCRPKPLILHLKAERFNKEIIKGLKFKTQFKPFWVVTCSSSHCL